MAEAVRFELTMGSHPRRFSRPVHSTTLPRFLSAETRISEGFCEAARILEAPLESTGPPVNPPVLFDQWNLAAVIQRVQNIQTMFDLQVTGDFHGRNHLEEPLAVLLAQGQAITVNTVVLVQHFFGLVIAHIGVGLGVVDDEVVITVRELVGFTVVFAVQGPEAFGFGGAERNGQRNGFLAIGADLGS